MQRVARKLEDLGKKYDHQFKIVFDAIRRLDQISSDNIVGLLARLGERLTGSAKEINR